MRPLFENAENLGDEERIATALVKHWRLDSYGKLSMSYGIDYAFLRFSDPRHAVVVFAEIKKRKLAFGYGDGYYLAAQKVMKGQALRRDLGAKVVLAVEFDDGIIRWCHMNTYGDRIIWAGRTDRNDPLDMEPHVVFDWCVFRGLT